MPSVKLHNKQARHNKKFLNEQVFNLNRFLYPDWYITVCFYYVLHLIDGKLASISDAYEYIGDHKVRTKLIDSIFKNTRYSPVIDLYRTLRTYSETARYGCVDIDTFTVRKATECMNRIEKLLSS